MGEQQVNAKLATVTSTVVSALVGVMLLVGVPGDPPTPTNPFPSVSANPDVCKAEKIRVQQAQLNYDYALNRYNTILDLYNRGAASAQEVRDARKALDQATLALNNARVAYATCQNNAANPPDKDCVNLALEINRLTDELAITKDLEAIAKANLDAAQQAFDQGALDPDSLARAKLAYEQAKLQTALIEQLLTDAKARAAAARCKDMTRPSPTPSPSGTPSPSPTPSPTRTPTSGPSGTATAEPSATVITGPTVIVVD
jgi:hypothetical protein